MTFIHRLTSLMIQKRNFGSNGFHIQDRQTGLQNETLSVGRAAVLEGENLSFDPRDIERGIFLLDNSGNTFRAQVYEFVNDNMVNFIVPGIIPGQRYDIVVKSYNQEGAFQETWLCGDLLARS